MMEEQYAAATPRAERWQPTEDQEAWLKDRLRDLIRMARAIMDNRGVAANDTAERRAIEGLCEGQAIEIILMLGGQPAWVNLKDPALQGQLSAPLPLESWQPKKEAPEGA